MKVVLLIVAILFCGTVYANDPVKKKSAFASACNGDTHSAMLESETDGSEVCVLPGGGNTYVTRTFVNLEQACKQTNDGVYPASIGLKQLNRSSTASITVTCFSRLKSRTDDRSGEAKAVGERQ